MQERWLKVEEVAERLGVHAESVRRWLRDGRMRGHIISRRGGWRVRESEIERFLVEGGPEGKLAA